MILTLISLGGCSDSPTGGSGGGASRLVSVGETSVTGAAGQTLDLTVRILSEGGSGLSGKMIHFTRADTVGRLSADSVATGSDGSASVRWTLGRTVGTQQVHASHGALRLTYQATVSAGSLARVRWSTTDPLLSLGLGVRSPVSARAEDEHGNLVATPAKIVIEQESRWLKEMPVLASAPLDSGLVSTVSPGRIVLVARSGDLSSAPLEVRVAPEKPTVLSMTAKQAVSDTDTVTLRGYRLDQVASGVSLDGRSVRLVSSDSAEVRFLPPLESGCTGAGKASVGVSGGAVFGPSGLSVRRARTGEVSLEAGKALALGVLTSRCLRLAPADGAEYAIAFLDARPIRRSETTREPRKGFADWDLARADYHSFAIADGVTKPTSGMSAARSLTVSPATASLRSAAVAPSDVRVSVAPRRAVAAADGVEHMLDRTTPFKVGDRGIFRLLVPTSCDANGACFGETEVEELGTVMRVYGPGNRYVVVLPDREKSYVGTETGYLSAADDYAGAFVRVGESMVQEIYGSGFPKSGPHGQIITILVHGRPNYAREWQGHRWVQITLVQNGRALVARWALFHEMAHLWQLKYMQERPGSVQHGTSDWALEGGANYVAHEIERVARGESFTANAKEPVFYGLNGPMASWIQSSGPSGGEGYNLLQFQYGYDSSEFLMRHLAHRLVAEGGMTEIQAITSVSRGALNGWHGLWTSDPSLGLTARMRAALGNDWDPARGLLEAMLAAAGDDRNPSTLFQVPSVLNMHKWYSSAGAVTAGGGATVERRGGQNALGYFRIQGEGHGGSYRLSSSLDGVEWMVLRLK